VRGRGKREERREMRDEREGIDDFSLFTKRSLWLEECCALDF